MQSLQQRLLTNTNVCVKISSLYWQVKLFYIESTLKREILNQFIFFTCDFPLLNWFYTSWHSRGRTTLPQVGPWCPRTQSGTTPTCIRVRHSQSSPTRRRGATGSSSTACPLPSWRQRLWCTPSGTPGAEELLLASDVASCSSLSFPRHHSTHRRIPPTKRPKD